MNRKPPSDVYSLSCKPDQRVVIAMLSEQEAPMLFVTRRASRIKRVIIAMLNEQEAPKYLVIMAYKPDQEGNHSYAR